MGRKSYLLRGVKGPAVRTVRCAGGSVIPELKTVRSLGFQILAVIKADVLGRFAMLTMSISRDYMQGINSTLFFFKLRLFAYFFVEPSQDQGCCYNKRNENLDNYIVTKLITQLNKI
jgi:hypothetical protein